MIDTEVLAAVGSSAGDRLVAAYRRMSDNGADPETIHRVLSDMLTSGRAAAAIDGEALALRQMGELGIDVTANVSRLSSREAQLQHVRSAAEARERYGAAVSTILASDDPEAVIMKLERLARSEAVDTAQWTSAEMMKRTRQVDGWIRQLDADPCEMCRWWWREGRVWPSNHTMPTHKGCECAQRWIRTPDIAIRDVSAGASAASARRAEAGTLDERRTMHEGAYSLTAARGRDETTD